MCKCCGCGKKSKGMAREMHQIRRAGFLSAWCDRGGMLLCMCGTAFSASTLIHLAMLLLANFCPTPPSLNYQEKHMDSDRRHLLNNCVDLYSPSSKILSAWSNKRGTNGTLAAVVGDETIFHLASLDRPLVPGEWVVAFTRGCHLLSLADCLICLTIWVFLTCSNPTHKQQMRIDSGLLVVNLIGQSLSFMASVTWTFGHNFLYPIVHPSAASNESAIVPSADAATWILWLATLQFTGSLGFAVALVFYNWGVETGRIDTGDNEAVLVANQGDDDKVVHL
ncbi:uncharacterized protein LOC142343896 isoform X2 [Convolutriloba macropyga]|uniref:uncharacterized protein LOC142343896 isoform X2 n=1 Tax=Convolutriloba macropyga TaxID=536237 RepID=UPI003F5218AC